MKKLISILLILSILCSFVACTQSDSNSKETEEETFEKKTTAPHTKHNVKKGKCSVCGLDYFEELKNLICEHGKKKSSTQWSYDGYFHHSGNTVSIIYDSSDNSILLSLVYSNSDRLKMHWNKANIKSQKYDWSYFDYSESKSVSGVLDATTFSQSTILVHNSSTFDSEASATSCTRKASVDLREILIEGEIPELLKKSTKNITLAHFGFENFE